MSRVKSAKRDSRPLSELSMIIHASSVMIQNVLSIHVTLSALYEDPAGKICFEERELTLTVSGRLLRLLTFCFDTLVCLEQHTGRSFVTSR